jgi:cytochrome b6-f complex iron-sulfur subunit
MKMDRKQFLVQVATLAVGIPCALYGKSAGATGAERLVNAGPAVHFANDGLYAGFRDQGFFVIRRGGKLFVLSAICTHRKCRLTDEPDRSFACDCHGSTFDPDGRVTEGPAKRDLPVLHSFTNERGELMVVVPAG